MADIKLDGLSDDQINLMKSYDIKVNDSNRSFSYLSCEDGTDWLHIIFYGTDGFSDAYNDKPLSYTIQKLTISDYGSISYDEAKQLNNDIKQYNLPLYALLKVIDNNDNSETYITADIEWDNYFTTSFDSNDKKNQTITIKGKLILPSYIKNRDDYDSNITYNIKVNGTGNNGGSNQGSNPGCEEYMNSKNWTWSETKKACVYMVSNTEAK